MAFRDSNRSVFHLGRFSVSLCLLFRAAFCVSSQTALFSLLLLDMSQLRLITGRYNLVFQVHSNLPIYNYIKKKQLTQMECTLIGYWKRRTEPQHKDERVPCGSGADWLKPSEGKQKHCGASVWLWGCISGCRRRREKVSVRTAKCISVPPALLPLTGICNWVQTFRLINSVFTFKTNAEGQLELSSSMWTLQLLSKLKCFFQSLKKSK